MRCSGRSSSACSINLGVPGQDDTNLLTGFEAIPGALAGMGLFWWLGVRQMRAQGRLPAH